MAKSPGKTLRRIGSDDLGVFQGIRLESQIERQYVCGRTAEQAAAALGVNPDDLAVAYAEIEQHLAGLDNEAFRLRVIRILRRSEIRSAKIRKAVRHFEKQAEDYGPMMGAIAQERIEDFAQLQILTKHLIQNTSSGAEMGSITSAILNALGDGKEVRSGTTREETSMMVALRRSTVSDPGEVEYVPAGSRAADDLKMLVGETYTAPSEVSAKWGPPRATQEIPANFGGEEEAEDGEW